MLDPYYDKNIPRDTDIHLLQKPSPSTILDDTGQEAVHGSEVLTSLGTDQDKIKVYQRMFGSDMDSSIAVSSTLRESSIKMPSIQQFQFGRRTSGIVNSRSSANSKTANKNEIFKVAMDVANAIFEDYFKSNGQNKIILSEEARHDIMTRFGCSKEEDMLVHLIKDKPKTAIQFTSPES